MTPRDPSEKPVGWLIVISKEFRDEIIEWFRQPHDGWKPFVMEVDGLKMQMNYPPEGLLMDCRFQTKEEALTALANMRLFGITRAQVPNRIPKYDVEMVSDGTLAKINPAWRDAPWSIEMVFPVGRPTVPERFSLDSGKYEGKVMWVNRENV